MEKNGFVMNISLDALMYGEWGEKFPRKVAGTVEHPIQPRTQAAYDEYVQRFETARDAWQRVQAEGEHLGWARSEGGYEWEPAEIQPLRPKIETFYAETENEWFVRVQNIMAHHQVSGEWIEEPRPTFRDRLMGQISAHYDQSIQK